MKVQKKLRQKRIEQFNQLYDAVTSNLDYYYKIIYRNIKKMTDSNKESTKEIIINAIYNSLEQTKFITERELKKIFSKSFQKKDIKIQDILYKKDGLTLEERISKWFEQTQKKEILSSNIIRILDTQTYQIVPRITKQDIKKNNEKIFVEIISGGTCSTGICLDYADGEAYPEDEIDLPPYHPNCECQAIYYQSNEIEI